MVSWWLNYQAIFSPQLGLLSTFYSLGCSAHLSTSTLSTRFAPQPKNSSEVRLRLLLGRWPDQFGETAERKFESIFLFPNLLEVVGLFDGKNGCFDQADSKLRCAYRI